MIDVQNSVYEKAQFSVDELERRELPDDLFDISNTSRSPVLCGDETFLISEYIGYCVLWCFDKYVKLIDEMAEFKFKREARKRHRREELREHDKMISESGAVVNNGVPGKAKRVG